MIIYKATNILNGKIYIGKTKRTLEKRSKEHIRKALKHDDIGNSYFHAAIRKYGPENFSWETIEFIETKTGLNGRETHWIAHYNSTNRDLGYNIKKGDVDPEYSNIIFNKDIKLYCHQNGIIYNNVPELTKAFDIGISPIREFLRGKIPSIEGYTFEEVIDLSKYPLPLLPMDQSYIPLGKRKVYCHQNQKIYNNHKEAEKYLGIPENRIMDTLTDITKSHLFISRYSFEWFDESKSYPLPVRPMGKDRSVKKVFCKETGKIYDNAREAERDTKIKSNRISEVCNGKRPHACNLHFEFIKAS